MNERPADFPLPLPNTKPKALGIGRKDGRIILASDGVPFAAFDIAQAAILAAKIMGECAILCNRVPQEMVDAAFEQAQADADAKSKIIRPGNGQTHA